MATVIDLGKIRFEYQGVYSGSTVYEWNDVVKYGGNVYVYKYGTATSGNVPTNTVYWDLMMEGFNFEGEYDSDTTYIIGDGFSYGGVVYITTANTVQGQRPPHASYSTFIDGLQYEGAWNSGTSYQLSDIVTHGGTSYVAKRDTVNEVPSAVDSAWDVFAQGIQVEGTYSAATAYQKDDIVTYGGSTYKALQDTTGNAPSGGAPNWEPFVSGFDLKDSFDSAVSYVKDDIVLFGGNLFRAKGDVTGTHPIDTISWEQFLPGLSFVGEFDETRKYFPGEVVKAGGELYVSILSSTNAVPSDSGTVWKLLMDGVSTGGTWTTATEYYPGTILKNGGSTFIVQQYHTAGTLSADITAGKIAEFVQGIRNRGAWASTTTYAINDIVQSGTSSYIALTNHTSTANFSNDESDGNWGIFAAGGSGVLPTITGDDVGKSLVVNASASGYELDYTDNSPNTFYVSVDGTDDSFSGLSAQRPFASVRFAMDHISSIKSADSTAMVLISEGTYEENLPITVPTNTTVKGDGQRNTRIKPQVGDEQETMFFVNNGVMMQEMVFSGLTGFVPDSNGLDHIENAAVGGVYLRLDPAAVITKSPYIKECSAFSSGGIGAIVDGGLNTDPNNAGSMVFHTYTQIHDGGVGFWVRRNGRAEIVSCFTYYCDFGYATSGGGFIRALNGNNSYGRFGAVSYGFDSNETTNDGLVRGYSLDYQDGTNTGGDFVGIVKSPDRLMQASTISRTSPVRVGTKTPHAIESGRVIRLDPQTPASWASSVDETIEYYATVIDSNNFDLYTNAARTTPLDGGAFGGRVLEQSTIVDIVRANPAVVTVNSHTFDSWDLLRIQNVGGMTQVNDRYFSARPPKPGGTLSTSQIRLHEGEHSVISVVNSGGNYTLTGTIGGVSYSASTEPAATLYRGSKYLFDIDSSVGGAFYLTTTDSTGWANAAFNGEYTTGVRNSRATAGNRMVILLDSSAPSTLHYANSLTGTLHGQFNVIDPATLDAGSYSAYTSGGTIRYLDSGDDLDSASVFKVGARADVINHQPGANKIIIDNIIGTGFIDGDSISDSSGTVQAILSDSDAAHDQYGFTMAFTGFTTAKPRPGGSLEFQSGNPGDSGYDSIGSYVIQTVSEYDSGTGNAVLVFSQQKTSQRPAPDGQQVKIRYDYSQARLTGHDFLNIGTGNQTQTNYPGDPNQPADQSSEVLELAQGRVYYVSTDQDGNFRVGNYFRIDQATGRATLDASAFDLSGLTSLRLGSIGAQLGASINEFSTDGTMSGNSNFAVPTEAAVVEFVNAKLEGASSLSLPATAKAGALATELYMGFNIYDLTKNDGKNLK